MDEKTQVLARESAALSNSDHWAAPILASKAPAQRPSARPVVDGGRDGRYADRQGDMSCRPATQVVPDAQARRRSTGWAVHLA